MNLKYIQLADKFAVSTSTICIIHCIALPFVISVFPALGISIMSDEAFHVLLLWVVIPLSAFGITLGCKRHKDITVLSGGILGVGILAFAALVGHDLLGENGERMLTLVGAFIIAIAHMRNFNLCRSTDCSHA